jgi:hypothetical protein
MYKAKFKDTDHGWKNWAKALRFLGGKQSSLEVGLIEGVSDPEDIFKGAVNEVGVPEKNIPPRPWMRTTLDTNANEYLKLLGERFVEEMERGMPGGDARIKAELGEKVAADLRKAITAWTEPANAPRTVRKKGFNNPLVERGDLQNAPTYRILKPGEKSNG